MGKPRGHTHGPYEDGSQCPMCLSDRFRKPDGVYEAADRNAWLNVALGQIAPAGTWPAQLFRDIYHAKTPEDAIRIAQAARQRFEAIWAAWDEGGPT